MGLKLPASGTVYLDANSIIYSVEKIEPYADLLKPVWLAARSSDLALVSSELAVVETLVKPIQDGDALLQSTFRTLLFASRELELIPINRFLLEQAAQFRADLGLKTPDAIHAATGLATACSLFITNDRGFRRVKALPVAILAESL